LRTPGHTPESTCYLLNNAILMTGDTLFPTSIGRPDLHADEQETRARSSQLYRSLHKLLTLPPETLVLPGHTSQPVPFDGTPIGSRLAEIDQQVGLERSIVPLLGQRVFGLASTTAVLSFIVSFGVVKALANLFAGRLSDRIGRKGVLVVGWLVGLPVPFLIIFAPSWGWVVFANVLLGINQGLCWSTTVIMKIDLVV